MPTLLIKNARYIVSCDDKDTLYERTNLYIKDGVIASIGRDYHTADQIIDASSMVVYPGLINTHHHLYQIFSRNLPEVQKMELFPWLVTLYEVWKGLDEEVVAYSTLTGLGELLKTGCTTCFDHHYVFPRGAGDLIAAQFRAAAQVGMRFVASRGSMDLSQKDGGLPPDSVVQTIDEIMADSERLVRVWHDPSPFSMRQVALAPCSPFSVSGDLLRESAKLARTLGVRLHTHVAETRDEEQFTLEKFGLRPIAYMQSLGWTGPDVWYAHGIHFNDDELRILAESDAAGPYLLSIEDGRQIFVTGHPEYDQYTLDAEYRRDRDKGLDIAPPCNYYPGDDPAKPPLFRWRAHAHLLYENWLNYYVYQNTPYDLETLERLSPRRGK